MSTRPFDVTLLDGAGGGRVVRVAAKTTVQAGDAAVAAAVPGESLGEILEVADVDDVALDAARPGTQTHPDDPV